MRGLMEQRARASQEIQLQRAIRTNAVIGQCANTRSQRDPGETQTLMFGCDAGNAPESRAKGVQALRGTDSKTPLVAGHRSNHNLHFTLILLVVDRQHA
jgi:hypothetical protein